LAESYIRVEAGTTRLLQMLVSGLYVAVRGRKLTGQMKEAKVVQGHLKALIQAMVARADAEVDALMPGYTHLQVC
jgi:hypothetical protein